jgi:hypothetical protein
MQYDVFICYSSKDRTTADTICSLLEKNGVTCWIAPRNVKPGTHYGEEIVNAIASSLSLLLILSENANLSVHVRNEIELGVTRSKVIFPVRIKKDLQPSNSLVYYISTSQWVEAWTSPLEQKMIELSAVIKALSEGKNDTGRQEDPVPDIDRGDNDQQISILPKGLDELEVILANQLEEHSFDYAGSTISAILAIDRDNPAALNAQTTVDKQHGFGKIKSFHGPGIGINAFFTHNRNRMIAGFGGITGTSPTAKPPTIIGWDLDSGQRIFEHPIQRPWKPTCLALSPDGQNILIGDLYGIYQINAITGKIISDYYKASWTQCIAYLPEGNKAITGGIELLLWDLDLGSSIYQFKGHNGRIQSLAVAPDGKLAVTGGEDATIRLWDLKGKKEIWCKDGFKVNFQSIAISRDGKQVIAGGNNIIRLLDLCTGEEMQNFKGHKGYTLSLAFSPDGQQVISGGTDDILRIWDIKNGHQIRGYVVSGSWTGSVGFSKDGRYASSGDGSDVNIWALPE